MTTDKEGAGMTDAERSLLLLVAAALRDLLALDPKTIIDRQRVPAIDDLLAKIQNDSESDPFHDR